MSHEWTKKSVMSCFFLIVYDGFRSTENRGWPVQISLSSLGKRFRDFRIFFFFAFKSQFYDCFTFTFVIQTDTTTGYRVNIIFYGFLRDFCTRGFFYMFRRFQIHVVLCRAGSGLSITRGCVGIMIFSIVNFFSIYQL